MESPEAYLLLLDEEKGTYLLRENSRGELRFSVRSQIDNINCGGSSGGVKLVGHIVLSKDEDEYGWFTGSGETRPRYDSFYDIIQAHKERDSIYLFKCHYKK